uniref:Protein-serine/threonine phosphatase n=1 Tax=Hanusia phi TaxID=3032 RepID=A0A7S0DWI9_9CRYP|mmetsp:Transcript_11818/g.27216  ORF Transcript_11818/g.27216 Transcript_11818/m.27216 type:complete len:240 (+) Transcript_11818:392-1111(+)|eukprot:756946-Hanusia_phi.AAC.1
MSPAAKKRQPLISLEEVMQRFDPIDCDDGSEQSWLASKRRSIASKRKWGVSLLEPSQAPPAEVLKGKLYIGNREQATNWDTISALGVTHIINVSREDRRPFASQVHYYHCGIPDEVDADLSKALHSSWDFFQEATNRSDDACVLVHCASGVSRSVAMVSYFLMRLEGISFYSSLERIRAKHPAAQPNMGFVHQLQALEHELCKCEPRDAELFRDGTFYVKLQPCPYGSGWTERVAEQVA